MTSQVHPVYRWLMFFWFCCAGLLLPNFVSAAEKSGELIIRVKDLPSSDGHVRFGLYNTQSTYKRQKDAFRKADLPIDGKTCVWHIKDLPFGEYALMLHHDENDNQKMDKNFLGIPKEGYGFSNDAEPGFSAPPFSQSKFKFDRPEMTLDVQLQR